jgi:hypothetical protein
MRFGIWIGIGIGLFAFAGVGCGGGGSKTPSSYGDMSGAFAHPSGTLVATNADDVAKAYQASLQAGLGTAAGRRLIETVTAAQTVAETIACPSGGSISVTASQTSSSSVSETFSYNNCCETAGCCLSGGGNLFYSSAGTAGGSFCESFSVSGTCSTVPLTESYSIC